MAIYGTYFTSNMLRQMKWPRKQGLMGKPVYDTMLVNMTLKQMVDWAAGIGAGNPKLATQILAELYSDRDWDADDAPNLQMFVDDLINGLIEKGINPVAVPPNEFLDTLQFGDKFKSLPANCFSDREIRAAIEQSFVNGILYGLSCPKMFEAWYELHLEDFNNNRELYERMELGVDRLPSLEEFYRDGKDIIDLYMQEMGKSFSEVPSGLTTAVKQIRTRQVLTIVGVECVKQESI